MKCHVPGNGYRWKRNKLMVIEPIGRLNIFEPHDGLFRHFATVAPDKEGILEFANRYGDLYTQSKETFTKTGIEYDSGSLGEWKSQIELMQCTVELWDAIDRNNQAKLREYIKWGKSDMSRLGESTIVYQYSKNDEPIHIADTGDYKYRHGELIRPAMLHVVNVINMQLAPDPYVGDHLIQVHPFLTWDGNSDNRPILSTHSLTLIGELWLQFARIVSTGYKHKTCKECGKYFLVEPKPGPTQLYCSPTCRVRNHRRGKQ